MSALNLEFSWAADLHMNIVQHLWQKHQITELLCPHESRAQSLLNNYSSPSWLAGTLMSVCVWERVCALASDTYLHACFIRSFCWDGNAAEPLALLSFAYTRRSNSQALNRIWWEFRWKTYLIKGPGATGGTSVLLWQLLALRSNIC